MFELKEYLFIFIFLSLFLYKKQLIFSFKIITFFIKSFKLLGKVFSELLDFLKHIINAF